MAFKNPFYIVAGSITTDLLAAGAVTAAKIAAGTITATQIAAGSITGSRIAVGTITSGLLAAGSITAGKIAAGAIDGMTITGALIRTAATGQRWELSSTNLNKLNGYSGSSLETAPGYLMIDDVGFPYMELRCGTVSGSAPPRIILENQDSLDQNVFIEGSEIEFGSVGYVNPWVTLNSGILSLLGASLRFRNGTTLNRMDYGTGTYTVSNSTGDMTINHGLGVTPSCVQVSPGALNARTLLVVGRTASTITVRVCDATGAYLANGSTCPVYWTVLQ